MVEFDKGVYTHALARTDAGLRAFMLGVYAYLGVGLFLCAMSALISTVIVSNNIQFFMLSTTGRILQILFSLVLPLLFLFASEMSSQATAARSKMFYWGYVICLGVSLGFVLTLFYFVNVFMALLLTSVSFASLCLYGYTTNRSLSAIGVFASMLGVGLLVLLLINLFVQSSTFDIFLNIGFLFFAAMLTAWNNQHLKLMYYQVEGRVDQDFMTKLQVRGAWSLFASFYLIFISILRLMHRN